MRNWYLGCAVLALAACSPQPGGEANDATANGEAEAEQNGAGLDRSNAGKAAPEIVFKDPDGEDVTLADFAGRPVLLNLWATWCGPCIKELPTLDALSAAGEGMGPHVIAVSQDMGPQASVTAFLDKLKLSRLDAYHDDKMALSGGLNAQILPTTILYDSRGKEVWRYVGELDWTGPEATKLLNEGAAKAG